MANEKPRLIDANALIKKEKPMDSITHGMVMAVQSERILEAPTVDAVEVVHGRWLNWKGEPISPDDYWRVWRCSECKNEMEFEEAVDRDEFPSNYCPNCGAKMDGKDDT